MMKNTSGIEVEVCAYSPESCRAAQSAGADRVELCASPYEGGTTPSAGTIRMAREILDRTQLYVMIRPRGGDFLYTEEEIKLMEKEIRFAREAGADGVVLGLLKPDGRIDVSRTARLVELAAPLPVTFHRAFDMSCGAEPGLLGMVLEEVIAAGCVRILTSGFFPTALPGKENIRRLTELAAGRIAVMAGSGVNASNAAELVQAGVQALHLSGKTERESGMEYRNPRLSMGGAGQIPEYSVLLTDRKKVEAVISVLSGMKTETD